VVLLLLFITSGISGHDLAVLMTIIMAGIFSALARPLYRRLSAGAAAVAAWLQPSR
jgi:hypothetical protein